MDKEEFLKVLARHDWFYQYSDDYSVWRRGQEASDRIQGLIQQHPELKEVYTTYVAENVRT